MAMAFWLHYSLYVKPPAYDIATPFFVVHVYRTPYPLYIEPSAYILTPYLLYIKHPFYGIS